MKFKAKIRKFLAVTLLVAMTVNLAPFSALASEAEQNSAEAVTEQETDGSSVQKEEASSEASAQEESMQPEETAKQRTEDEEEEESEEAEMPASEEEDSEKKTAGDVAANDGSSMKEAENDVSSEAGSGSSSQNEADRNANDGSEANEVKKNNFLRSAGSGNTIDISDLKSKTYKDGTYEGTTECFVEDEDISYTLKVTVTVSGGKIIEIVPEITEDNSSRADQRQNKSCLSDASEGYGDYEGIPTQIIAKDDAVDIVSEATYSSRSIVEAVRIALQDAEAEEAVVNKDELKALVESAAALIESEYTEESWKAFKSALTAATQVLNNDKASQEEVDAQVKALTEAQKALVKKPQEGYVLMNIPYGEFFAAEGVSGVDAVTSATVKTYNQNMAGGSYHDGDGGEILGVTYPVYVKDFTVLEGLTQVKDDTTAVITVAAGKSATTTKEVSGKDVLFASGDYAYYVMSGKPANFKTLSGTAGNFSFSAVENGAESRTMTSAEMIYTGHHTQLQLNVDADGLADGVLTGVLLTADGETYALRHVVEVWKRVELGWNWDELDGNGLSGKTITNLTYYLQDGGVYSYDVNITVKKNPGEAEAVFEDEDTIKVTGLPEDMKGAKAKVQTKVGRGETPVVLAEEKEVGADGSIELPKAAVLNQAYTILITSDDYADLSLEATCLAGYVLMNIPYGEFYAAEGTSDVDAVSSATRNKPRTIGLAGGSYHVNADGSDITGVIYPVHVKDITALADCTQITDESTVSITVTNRGQTSTTEFTGKEALFEAPSYAYYILTEKPALYKELNAADGAFSFGSVNAEAGTVTGATGEVNTAGRHTNIEIALEGLAGISSGTIVSGVILTDDSGNLYGLRHVYNIWRGTELGWNEGEYDLAGKTIKNIRYYTQESVTDYPVEIYIPINTGITVTVEDGLVSDGKTKVTLSDALPDDFNAQYTVENLKDAKGSETELTYSTDAAIGKYELVISDNSGKYAEIKTSFTIYTNEIPAIVGESTTEPALAVNKEGGASDEEFADYLEKISKVTIGGKEYPAKDSRYVKAVPIINTDPEKGEAGAIDLNAKDANGDYIFPGDGEYVLTAEAEGYADADFKITVTAPEIIEGDGTKWTTDSTEGFDIVSDAPFKWFREVVLDGEKMEEPAISEGSTHVTLSADLLGTLTTGDHTLSIVSGNGTATATFTVAEPESKVEPQDDVKKDDVKKDDSKKDGKSSESSSSTSSKGSKSGTGSSKKKSTGTGDESNLLLWLLLIALSGAALAGAVYRRRIGEK